jgi:hypothetical protein
MFVGNYRQTETIRRVEIYVAEKIVAAANKGEPLPARKRIPSGLWVRAQLGPLSVKAFRFDEVGADLLTGSVGMTASFHNIRWTKFRAATAGYNSPVSPFGCPNYKAQISKN